MRRWTRRSSESVAGGLAAVQEDVDWIDDTSWSGSHLAYPTRKGPVVPALRGAHLACVGEQTDAGRRSARRAGVALDLAQCHAGRR